MEGPSGREENLVLKQALTDFKATLASLREKIESSKQLLADEEYKKCKNSEEFLKLQDMKKELGDQMAHVSKMLRDECDYFNHFKKEKENLLEQIPGIKKKYYALRHMNENIIGKKIQEKNSKQSLEELMTKETHLRLIYKERWKAYLSVFYEYERERKENLRGLQGRWVQISDLIKDLDEACETLRESTASSE